MNTFPDFSKIMKILQQFHEHSSGFPGNYKILNQFHEHFSGFEISLAGLMINADRWLLKPRGVRANRANARRGWNPNLPGALPTERGVTPPPLAFNNPIRT